mgnify:CR=1 FL=1
MKRFMPAIRAFFPVLTAVCLSYIRRVVSSSQLFVNYGLSCLFIFENKHAVDIYICAVDMHGMDAVFSEQENKRR